MRRHINILYEDLSPSKLEELLEVCKLGNYEFSFRYIRTGSCSETDYKLEDVGKIKFSNGSFNVPLFYFSIFSDTKGFETLNDYFDNKLLLTDFSEFSNIADMDDSFEETFKDIIFTMRRNKDNELLTNRNFLDFIMPIKSIETLEAMKMYSCHMTDFQKGIIEDRISILKNENYKFEEEMMEVAKSLSCDVLGLRKRTGMSRKDFCKYFGIPYRTVEDWENHKSTISSYLFKLMEEKLKNEKLI